MEIQKSNWKSFIKSLDDNIRWIKQVVNNYDRFCGIVKGVAKQYILRGYRHEYIPCWDKISENLCK